MQNQRGKCHTVSQTGAPKNEPEPGWPHEDCSRVVMGSRAHGGDGHGVAEMLAVGSWGWCPFKSDRSG
eukprot:1425844-Alexandrium_andersonii.AAC.1